MRVYYWGLFYLKNFFREKKSQTMSFLSHFLHPNSKHVFFLSLLAVVLIRFLLPFQAENSDFEGFTFDLPVSVGLTEELQSADLPECRNQFDKSRPPCNPLYKRASTREQTKNVPCCNTESTYPEQYRSAQAKASAEYFFIQLTYHHVQYTDKLFSRDGPRFNVLSIS